MGTPSEFMEKVVAWPGANNPGFINIHTFRADKKDRRTGKEAVFGKPFRELDPLMDYVQYCASNPGKHSAIFFCTSTQKDKRIVTSNGKNFDSAVRSRQNAIWLKSVWFDIDVGKKEGYNADGEALDALQAFRVAAGLPPPSALVHTGGGLHCYWISDKPLTQHEWQGYAEGLKDAAQKHGLKADLQCTADSARILRMPGTWNTKYDPPRRCRILFMGGEYDFSQAFAHVRKEVTPPVTIIGTGRTASTFANTEGWMPRAEFAVFTDSLADGIEKRGAAVDPTPVFKQCQHFRASLRDGGRSDPEPLWMLNLLACTFMENGEEFAHALSEKYPSYSPEETQAKFDQRVKYKSEKNLGWPSCTNFEGAGANCAGCPLKGTIRSPLNLATPIKAPPPPPPVTQDLPPNYVTGPRGWICEETERVKGAEVLKELLPLFMCKLRNFTVARDGDRPVMHVDVNLDMGNWRKASIYESDLANEQKLTYALRREGIKPYPKNKGRIEQFMTSFWSQLDAAQYRSNTLPFGWLYDPKKGQVPVGFAYGGKVFCADGTEGEAGATDPVFGPLYMPKGDTESKDWWTLMDLITVQHHPALETLVAISFAAPLLIGSGLYNATVCGWSPEAGAHKTTSVHTGLAVWGEPKRSKEKPNATQKGLMKKAGETRNLPIYWDEISDEAKLNKVRLMLGDLTEGGQGTRLKQDRSAFAYDEWQTILAVCGNKSLTDNIMANNSETDAQLQRLFEFQVEKRADTIRPHDAQLLVNSLDFNFGFIGLKFAKVLGNDPKGAMDFVKQTIDKFVDEAQAGDDEKSAARFRSAVAATVWAGAAMANKHIGTKFNLDELWVFLVTEFKRQNEVISKAEVVAGQKQNTVNILTQFFKARTRNTLWLQKMPVVVGRGRPQALTWRAGPSLNRPDPVHVRCAEANRVIEVSKYNLCEWFNMQERDAGPVIGSLRNHFGAKEYPRIDLSYGSGVMGGRETVISIPVPNISPFAGVLYKHCPPDERPAGVHIDYDVTEPVTLSADTQPSLAPTGIEAKTDGNQPVSES